MTKKIILLLYICAIPFFVKAQTICGEVMYKEEVAFSLFFQTITITKFNKNAAFTKYVPYQKAEFFLDKVDDIGDYEDDDLEIRSGNHVPYYYNTKDESFFTEGWWSQMIITVEENPFKWDWELIDETKKVGKFHCKKAAIQFRGRTFIAWYTPEIPASFGPKKFKGLPGLILEVFDSEKKWYMKAIKVKLSNTKKCNITDEDFNLKETKEKAVSVKRYLQLVDSLHIDELKKESSKMPRGQGIPIPNRCDRFYNGVMVEIFKRR